MYVLHVFYKSEKHVFHVFYLQINVLTSMVFSPEFCIFER